MVLTLLKLSHRSRAYIQNAEDLKGFLVDGNIKRILGETKQNGKLEKAFQWQNIELEKLSQQLSACASYEGKMAYLRKQYPMLFVYFMEFYGKEKKIQEFQMECKSFEEGQAN